MLGAILLLSACSSPAAPQRSSGSDSINVIQPHFFGMDVTSIADRPDGLYGWPTEPFGGCRLWDAHGTKSLYAAEGQYDWTALDRNVDSCLSRGKEVMYVFGGVANWMNRASSSCGTWACEPGKPPLDNADWLNMVKAVVQRYQGKIKYYELWNEPNDNLNGWSGTVPQLMELVRGEYSIIRQNDAEAIIISPTVSNSDVAYFTSLLQNGAGNYADLIGFHGYISGQSGATTASRPPEAIAVDLNSYTAALKTNGISKQLIDTEGSWGLCDDQVAGFCGDQDLQAAYIAVRYVLAASYKLHSFWWYAWNGDNQLSTNWGSLWHDRSNPEQCETKAGRAYGIVNSWLVGASFADSGCSVSPDKTWTCTITRPNGYRGWIVWNQTSAGVFTVPREARRKRDLDGNTVVIVPGSAIGMVNKPILLENTAPQP